MPGTNCNIYNANYAEESFNRLLNLTSIHLELWTDAFTRISNSTEIVFFLKSDSHLLRYQTSVIININTPSKTEGF